MTDFSKAERRILREIAGEEYEAEAHRMLEQLDAKFQSWREGALFSSELIREIHDFHQHDSRDLWSVYRVLKEASIVARGLALDLIPQTRVSPEIRVKLEFFVGLYKRDEREAQTPEEDDDD